MAYTITGEKCGTVRLDAEKTGVVVTESVQRSSKVTSNPVEKGSDINDHVINDPVVFSITGVFLDEDQSDILERMWKEKDVVEYTGRTRISDCVITSFKSDISADNKNGSRFTVSLKVINRVSAEYVESGEQMMSAQDANASKKVSKSQTKIDYGRWSAYHGVPDHFLQRVFLLCQQLCEQGGKQQRAVWPHDKGLQRRVKE